MKRECNNCERKVSVIEMAVDQMMCLPCSRIYEQGRIDGRVEVLKETHNALKRRVVYGKVVLLTDNINDFLKECNFGKDAA